MPMIRTSDIRCLVTNNSHGIHSVKFCNTPRFRSLYVVSSIKMSLEDLPLDVNQTLQLPRRFVSLCGCWVLSALNNNSTLTIRSHYTWASRVRLGPKMLLARRLKKRASFSLSGSISQPLLRGPYSFFLYVGASAVSHDPIASNSRHQRHLNAWGLSANGRYWAGEPIRLWLNHWRRRPLSGNIVWCETFTASYENKGESKTLSCWSVMMGFGFWKGPYIASQAGSIMPFSKPI